eukprot:TRINITY_DN80403_c0_g1_i1.p1 TRINITY_DN80403_c0_g1~~TRINITY_DN80403_c0_g1_i1.p1  ORF type:complete len:167 (+),score=41.53 TRINITY_DN80403_c0_g1_i1:66-566(+)
MRRPVLKVCVKDANLLPELADADLRLKVKCTGGDEELDFFLQDFEETFAFPWYPVLRPQIVLQLFKVRVNCLSIRSQIAEASLRIPHRDIGGGRFEQALELENASGQKLGKVKLWLKVCGGPGARALTSPFGATPFVRGKVISETDLQEDHRVVLGDVRFETPYYV